MSARSKLKAAMSTIEDAIRALKRAQVAAPSQPDIRRAIRELDDAHELIRRAAREVE